MKLHTPEELYQRTEEDRRMTWNVNLEEWLRQIYDWANSEVEKLFESDGPQDEYLLLRWPDWTERPMIFASYYGPTCLKLTFRAANGYESKYWAKEYCLIVDNELNWQISTSLYEAKNPYLGMSAVECLYDALLAQHSAEQATESYLQLIPPLVNVTKTECPDVIGFGAAGRVIEIFWSKLPDEAKAGSESEHPLAHVKMYQIGGDEPSGRDAPRQEAIVPSKLERLIQRIGQCIK